MDMIIFKGKSDLIKEIQNLEFKNNILNRLSKEDTNEKNALKTEIDRLNNVINELRAKITDLEKQNQYLLKQKNISKTFQWR